MSTISIVTTATEVKLDSPQYSPRGEIRVEITFNNVDQLVKEIIDNPVGLKAIRKHMPVMGEPDSCDNERGNNNENQKS